MGKLCPTCTQSRRAADPGNGLQIAQAARTFFQIGFEIEISIDKARVALVLLVLFGEKKLAQVEVLLHGVL